MTNLDYKEGRGDYYLAAGRREARAVECRATREAVEEWCRGIRILFGQPPYMVGSANERPDYRDIDLRLILADDDFDAAWRNPVKLRLMNRAMSTWGQRETGLPIDFQIQRQSEANRTYPEGARTPMGVRDWRTNVPAAVLVDEVGANPQEEDQ